MPVYDFKCNECGLKFEISLKIADSHIAKCPSCKKETTNKLPSKGVLSKMGEVTSIPKDIDLAVGKSAEERWMQYEERSKKKEEIRKNTDTNLITRDPDGNYAPLAIQKNGKNVGSKEALNVRQKMYDQMETIKKDSSTETFVNESE